MSRTAKVQSIDALSHMAASLQTLGEEVTTSLDDLGMQIQRAVQWIQYERKDYWTQEYRRAQEAVAEARINLERRKMFRVGDQAPACREEKMALEAAKRRMETARAKIEAVKRWARLLEHEATDCRTATAPLAHWGQAEVPRGLAVLRRMGMALESYVGQRGPAIAEAGADLSATSGGDMAAPAAEPPPPGEATDTPGGDVGEALSPDHPASDAPADAPAEDPGAARREE